MTVSLASLNLRKPARGGARKAILGRPATPAAGRAAASASLAGKAAASIAAGRASAGRAVAGKAVARRGRPAPDLSMFVALTPLDVMLDDHLADGGTGRAAASSVGEVRRAAARRLLIGGLIAGTLLAAAAGGLIAVSVAVAREFASA